MLIEDRSVVTEIDGANKHSTQALQEQRMWSTWRHGTCDIASALLALDGTQAIYQGIVTGQAAL